VGPDIDIFDAAIDLFDGYKSKEDAAFPRTAVGPDNKYYGFSTNFQAFIVNTKMMPLDKAPQSWTDLAKPEYKGKIVIANPAQSGSGYSQMIQILQLYGWERDGQDHRHRHVRHELAARVPERREGRGSRRAHERVQHPREQARRLSGRLRLSERRHGAHQRRERHRQGWPQSGQCAQVHGLRQLEAGAPDDRRHRQAAQRPHRHGPPAGLPDAKSLQTFPYDYKAATTMRKANLERFDKTFSSK
jgi:hypothetical protein